MKETENQKEVTSGTTQNPLRDSGSTLQPPQHREKSTSMNTDKIQTIESEDQQKLSRVHIY